MTTKAFRTVFVFLIFALANARADMMSAPAKDEKSPSKDQVLWTETDVGYDLESEYDYIGAADTDFGNGHQAKVSESYSDIRNVVTRRFFLAFLLHGGVEWQRMDYNSPAHSVLVPNELDAINGFAALDFRWSQKDLVRLQFEPGYYSDGTDYTGSYFNVPIALGYTHVPSLRLQWAIGLSYNGWRNSHFLPGGGLRYSLNDRWKLKFILPTPQIEYKATDTLHTWVGANFTGNTFRVSRTFGDDHGVHQLNGTLLDYEEIRIGTGLSWNIRPLIEFNTEAGWMADRKFDYHDVGLQSSGRGAPYVSVNIRILFQVIKDNRPMPEQIRAMQYEFPALQQFFKLPS